MADLDDTELLARFVMFHDWVRADGTVRPDAFKPPKDLNFSATRHIGLNETELWHAGNEVANERMNDLLGRADISVRSVSSLGLSAQAAPLPRNQNHAHITGWPLDKLAQKNLALELSALSRYVPKP